jgi:hypothetical protein
MASVGGCAMPYSHTIHPQGKYALLLAEGECDLDQTIVAMTTLVKDPGWRLDLGILVDARRIEYAPGAEETRQLATVASQRDFFLDHPMAIVAGQDLNYGIARMFTAFAGLQGATAEVFRDMEEARAWLEAAIAARGARDPSGEET